MIQDLKLDPEYQKKLRAYLPIQPEITYLYVPEIYRLKDIKGKYMIAKDKWPVFIIEPNNALHVATLQDETMADPNKPGSAVLSLIKRHVKGWRNWAVEFDEKKHRDGARLNDEAIKMFRGPLIEELFLAIVGSNELTEEELRGLE